MLWITGADNRNSLLIYPYNAIVVFQRKETLSLTSNRTNNYRSSQKFQSLPEPDPQPGNNHAHLNKCHEHCSSGPDTCVCSEESAQVRNTALPSTRPDITESLWWTMARRPYQDSPLNTRHSSGLRLQLADVTEGHRGDRLLVALQHMQVSFDTVCGSKIIIFGSGSGSGNNRIRHTFKKLRLHLLCPQGSRSFKFSKAKHGYHSNLLIFNAM